MYILCAQRFGLPQRDSLALLKKISEKMLLLLANGSLVLSCRILRLQFILTVLAVLLFFVNNL